MATGVISSDTSDTHSASTAKSSTAPFDQSIWQAPLVPAALALTAGIVIDRYASVPLLFSISIILAALVAWAVTRLGRPSNLGLMYLALAGAASAQTANESDELPQAQKQVARNSEALLKYEILMATEPAFQFKA